MPPYPQKQYRLGRELANGRWTVEVADAGRDNWRQRETCGTLEIALGRVRELTVAADPPPADN